MENRFWKDLVEDYLELKEVDDITIANYRVDLTQLSNFLTENDYNKDNLTTRELTKYSKFLKKNEYAPATWNRKLISINGFIEYLQKINVIGKDVENIIPFKANPYREAKFMEREDIEKLRLAKELDFKNPDKLRDDLIIDMLLVTALRLAELTEIELTDIKGQELRVIGKGNKEGFIPMPQKLMNRIKEYVNEREVESNVLFVGRHGGKMTTNGVRKIINKRLKLAGLEDKGFTPHSFRHTSATQLDSSGVPLGTIKELLRHNDIEITQRYIHSPKEEKINAMDAISNALL